MVNSSNLTFPALAPVVPDPVVSACATPKLKLVISSANFAIKRSSVVSPSGLAPLPCTHAPDLAASGNHKKLSAAIANFSLLFYDCQSDYQLGCRRRLPERLTASLSDCKKPYYAGFLDCEASRYFGSAPPISAGMDRVGLLRAVLHAAVIGTPPLPSAFCLMYWIPIAPNLNLMVSLGASSPPPPLQLMDVTNTIRKAYCRYKSWLPPALRLTNITVG